MSSDATDPSRFAEPARHENAVPGELHCYLLISQALDKAWAAASGGPPTTIVFRSLDLAERWAKEGNALLADFQHTPGANLADFLKRLCTDTIPLLIAETRRALPEPGNVDEERRENEIFKEVRTEAYRFQNSLNQTLKKNAAFVALNCTARRWPILGFSDEAAYKDFLQPSVRILVQSPDPLQRDLFMRLLAQPEFSQRQLTGEGYSPALVADTLNALLAEKWAKWINLSKFQGTLTPAGQRVLKQLVTVPTSTNQSHTNPDALEIRREKPGVEKTPAVSTKPTLPMTSPKGQRSIVWLHLSDLHFCNRNTGWDAHRVLKPLVHDLKKMERDHGLCPQLLFFTGDAAFGNIGDVKGSTLPEQFDGAHKLIEEARKAFTKKIPQKNVFIVPGNHDVDRDEVTADQTAWLAAQTEQKTITGLIHKAGKQWQKYLDRLKAYRDFLARWNYSHLLADPERLIYSQTREFHGLKLGIAGFNSSWSCSENGEKGKLWFGGDWQAGELVNQLGKVDFRLALVHHPFGWFVEHEDSTLRPLFERDFAFHLHGHEHLGWVDAKADGHVRVAAAACYASSQVENGYNFVRLNLETGEGEVWLRKYDPHGGGWVPRVVSGKTNNDGLWRLGKLPCLQPPLAKLSATNPQ